MMYYEVRTTEEMLEYMIECTLATVEYMISRKRFSKYEIERQCSIAQKAISFLQNREGGYSFDDGRVSDFANKGISALEYYSELRKKYHGE